MATWLTREGIEFTGKVYNETAETACYDYTDKCYRCGGAGGWKGWPGFTCYRCHGTCYEPTKTAKIYTAEKLAKLNAAQAKRNARKAEVAAAKQAERKAQVAAVREQFVAANAEAIATLRKYADRDGFAAEMLAKLDQYGSLSEKQIAAALAGIERTKAREASQFVGTEGKRVEMTLTCEKVIALPSANPYWATQYLHLCRDEKGNRVVYKGAGSFLATGETGKVTATIAGHETYNDEQQTKIARPKVAARPACGDCFQPLDICECPKGLQHP